MLVTAHQDPWYNHTMRYVDTLVEYRKLILAGYGEAEAEAQVSFVSESVKLNMDSIATKDDLKNLEIVTKEDIKHLAITTKENINHLANVLYLMGGAIFTVVCIPILQKILGVLIK